MVTKRSVWVGWIGALLGLAACDGSVTQGNEGGDGAGGGATSTSQGGSGGGTTTTTATTTTTSTTTTTATSTTTTTATSQVCAPFADEQGTGTVTVRFRNNTGMPLYLPAGCSNVRYTIKTPGGGDPAVTYAYEPSCLQTCEELWTAPRYACGACAPMSYLLEPGGTRDVIWDGTGLTYETMPTECYAYPDDAGGCSRIVTAPAGSYVVDALGYSGCEGDCTCDVDGVCLGSASGAQAIPDPTTLSFPEDSLVEVLFGSCAFGCP